jgi:hypothetical protein
MCLDVRQGFAHFVGGWREIQPVDRRINAAVKFRLPTTRLEAARAGAASIFGACGEV